MTFSERTYQVIIGVLVLIIIIGGWLMFAGKASAPATESDQMASSSDMTGAVSSGTDTTGQTSSSGATYTTMPAGSDAVSVVDQSAGSNVAVKSVSLEAAGWVAVRDASGKTLGAAWFPAGTQMNVSVSLLRATVAGQRYQVLLYADNGDKQFDLHTDTLLTQSDGSVAGTTFTAN